MKSNSTTPRPSRSEWLTEPLSRDVAQSLERVANSAGVSKMAVMPDVHLAEGVCIGMCGLTTAAAASCAMRPHRSTRAFDAS
jgi:RNA-splicing ligase RtcB